MATKAFRCHPKLEHTWPVSSAKLPFLDMYLIPHDYRVTTSIYYFKETDNHSYPHFKSSRRFKCKASIPASQLLRLQKLCSEDDDFEEAATTMESFFVRIVREGKYQVPRTLLLAGKNANQTGTNRVPMVTIYHPKNTSFCKILSPNTTFCQMTIPPESFFTITIDQGSVSP